MSKVTLSRQSGEFLPNQVTALERHLGSIQYQPVSELRAYKNNPRKHPEKQIVKLMASISEFGFSVPALIDIDGTIIAGEARIEAARRLGISEVPALVADQWSKAQIQAYRIADNKLASLSS
jgi:ParB-like chromosome segregation protein Spo0J